MKIIVMLFLLAIPVSSLAFVTPKGNHIMVPALKGEPIQVNNPYKLAKLVQHKTHNVLLADVNLDHPDTGNYKGYHIWYFPSPKEEYTFRIVMTAGDNKMRIRAENDTLRILGITRKQATKLRIWIGTYNSYDVAGNFGWSFAKGRYYPY